MGFDQPQAHRVDGRLGAAVDPKSLVEVLEMIASRLGGHAELLGDLLVSRTGSGEPQDFTLAGGQLAGSNSRHATR